MALNWDAGHGMYFSSLPEGTKQMNGASMRNKLMPRQMVLGYSALLAFVLVSNALVWKWPDYSEWFLGSGLVLIAVFLFFVFRAARKTNAS